MSKTLAAALALSGALVIAGASGAEPDAAAPTTAASPPEMRAAIDPATGKVRAPTPEENAALKAARGMTLAEGAMAMGVPAKTGPARVMASGAVALQLGAEHWSELSATLGADGQVVMGHGAGAPAKAEPAPAKIEER